MAETHRLKFNGYSVGDRLLEGVYFAVLLEIEGESATIRAVEPWEESDRGYLERINLSHFIPLIEAEVQSSIDHLRSYCAEQGSSLQREMEEWELETGEPGIQVLVEV